MKKENSEMFCLF